MATFESWQDVVNEYAVDIDDVNSFVLQPLDLLLVMGEMIKERAATQLYNPGFAGSYSTPGLLAVPRWEFYIEDMMEFFDEVWAHEAFLYNIDPSGNVISDPEYYNSQPFDEIKAWTEADMEEFLGMERPGPYSNDPDYDLIPDWIDPYPSADWMWWHFNALSLFTYANMHDVYDTPFTGYEKEGRASTWKDAIIDFNADPWTVSFTFVLGGTNTAGVGHYAEMVDPSDWIVRRNKLENCGVRMPQVDGSVLYDRKCTFYHYLLSGWSEGAGYLHSNKDFNVSRRDLYLEGAYQHVPVYDDDDNLDILDLSPILEFGNVNILKPQVAGVQYGYASSIAHRNLQPSRWGEQHRSFADFDVPGGYVYRNVRGLLPS